MTLFGELAAEVETNSPANLFHELLSCKTHLISTISPKDVQSVDLVKGEWGKQGSITQWSFTHDGVAKVSEEMVETIDKENLSTTFKVIGGDILKEYKSFKFILKATPKGEGSLVRLTLEFEKLNANIPDPHALLELSARVCKDAATHLAQAQT